MANMAKNTGARCEDILPLTLPVNREVLQYLHHRKNVPQLKGKPLAEVVSCPQAKGKSDMTCSSPGGCSHVDPGGGDSDSVECVVHKVRTK